MRHGSYFAGSGDLLAAYKLANREMTEDGETDGSVRWGFTDTIKQLL